MSRTDLTDITLVLDRSGSMQSIKPATIEAFNGFLNSQRQGAGMARMSLVQFDDKFENVYTAQPVEEAPELTDRTFEPRGSTALLDAMGRTIKATGDRLRHMPEPERPGSVLFVTLTDGEENSSREYTLARINEMISHQRDKYSWELVFLGANQDAIATAAQMGIDSGHAMTLAASPAGVQASLKALGGHVLAKRRQVLERGGSAKIQFTEEERAAAMPDND